MPGTPMLRLAVLALALSAVLPALAPVPAAARSPACPDRALVTVGELLDLAPSMGGASKYGSWRANRRAHACFGGATIRLRGFANWPEGIGGTSISGVEPRYFEWPQLFLFTSGREVATGYGAGPFYGIVVPPRFGRVERAFHRVWVDVTARFSDPLASRCRGYGPRGDRPPRPQAVASCRDTLVMTSIRVASGPPETAAAVDPRSPEAPGATNAAWLLLALATAVGLAAGWRRVRRPAVGQRR